ncbi:unnamed protein product [Diatraea saccharalis]|uniref:Uncharacterized protein n=1 Tax=Diatraea saccharalis TaxID=40085 RepID=A0A9N9WKE4_9NEOP|nr:unnamed protein product [Diatraea saccharalis]
MLSSPYNTNLEILKQLEVTMKFLKREKANAFNFISMIYSFLINFEKDIFTIIIKMLYSQFKHFFFQILKHVKANYYNITDIRNSDYHLMKVIISSSSAHIRPLLDIGLHNCTPSTSILGCSHPAPASQLA